jgi:hypothetical protein
MEEEYIAICDVCDIETQVLVSNSEDVPAFCPMCGSDVDFENLSEE